MTTDHASLELLRLAVEIAGRSRAHGNGPFGAVLADRDGRVLATAENTARTSGDPTAHAETNLVREVAGRLSREELAGTTLYASTEPCAMCAGAVFFSGIGAVVYALAAQDLGAFTGDSGGFLLELPCREVFAAGSRPVLVHGPVDLPEARAVHEGAWSSGTPSGPP